MRLNSIGTRFLKVCEWSDCVANQCFGLVRVQGGKNEAQLDW